MKLASERKPVMASWLLELGHRLDAPPFLSGAIESRKILEALHQKKDKLSDVTENGINGIIHAGRISRRWVDDEDHGVPFLSSTDILEADLSHLKFISNTAVSQNPKLIVKYGWTLITRSGTIGRSAFCREEMDGLACTEDVLRIAPDPKKIPIGYLYAFLSSRFGVNILTSGTYGAIIQHIEPEHVFDLPVPRFASKIESEISALVLDSSKSREMAARLKREAIEAFRDNLGLPDITSSTTTTAFSTFTTSSRNLGRLDAAHHSQFAVEAELALSEYETSEVLGDVCKVWTPGFFKRIRVEDPTLGYKYFSGSDLFLATPTPRGWLSKLGSKIKDYLVDRDWLLIQDAGQLGGLIGRLVRVSPEVESGAVSNHLIRIRCETRSDAAYIFSALSSRYGYLALTRRAFGTSIPQIESSHVASMKIPWPSKGRRNAIGKKMIESWDLYDHANSLEREAIGKVEALILGGD